MSEHFQFKIGGPFAYKTWLFLDDWVSTPTECLALAILLNQFPRNIYRNKPEMWSGITHFKRYYGDLISRMYKLAVINCKLSLDIEVIY